MVSCGIHVVNYVCAVPSQSHGLGLPNSVFFFPVLELYNWSNGRFTFLVARFMLHLANEDAFFAHPVCISLLSLPESCHLHEKLGGGERGRNTGSSFLICDSV